MEGVRELAGDLEALGEAESEKERVKFPEKVEMSVDSAETLGDTVVFKEPEAQDEAEGLREREGEGEGVAVVEVVAESVEVGVGVGPREGVGSNAVGEVEVVGPTGVLDPPPLWRSPCEQWV